ncbi:hypothetical protein HYH02_011829 [Chlamydomonas schloesseri]|uniref:ubiquitinyl hydrolase 1 n=1 Tax=Chlamydomonas schloesseri TaxID=2026947 RepID=A0A835W188_9CHLO|nr:hypothetical protein HYH02_011829 [Chlamydomonas schloesseri]|eukprot:KAG2435535.1 hypothetical protein HYH02_011829 [Chlamydomonas schloesseri]
MSGRLGGVSLLHSSPYDEYKGTSYGLRPPSAGRRPPSARALLPEFPQKRDDGGYRGAGSLAATLGYTSSYGSNAAAAGYGTGSYGASATMPASAARSTSVPRQPSGRATGTIPAAGIHLSTQPAAGYSTSSVNAAAAAAAAHMGMRTHGVGAGVGGGGVRSAVMPGSILDSRKTPSVAPAATAAATAAPAGAGGSIASLALAQRVNSSSGLDYGSLTAGGASSSAVRLKRQALGTGDAATGAAAAHGYQQQYTLHTQPQPAGQTQQPYTYTHTPPDTLRAIYVSGPAAGSFGTSGGASSARRPSMDRSGVPRAGSFTSGSAAAAAAAAAASAAAANSMGQGPTAPPLLSGAGGGGGGTVYASQYASQYGSQASTVFIPTSAQHQHQHQPHYYSSAAPVATAATAAASASSVYHTTATASASAAQQGPHQSPAPPRAGSLYGSAPPSALPLTLPTSPVGAATAAAVAAYSSYSSAAPAAHQHQHYHAGGPAARERERERDAAHGGAVSPGVHTGPLLASPSGAGAGAGTGVTAGALAAELLLGSRVLQRNSSSISSRGSAAGTAQQLPSTAGASGRLRALGAANAAAAAAAVAVTAAGGVSSEEVAAGRWSGSGVGGVPTSGVLSGSLATPLVSSPRMAGTAGISPLLSSPKGSAPLSPSTARAPSPLPSPSAARVGTGGRTGEQQHVSRHAHTNAHGTGAGAGVGAALDGDGSSYSSTASGASGASGASSSSSSGGGGGSGSSKASSMAVAGGTAHMSSASTSRTTSTTSQRSLAADAAGHGHAHAHGAAHPHAGRHAPASHHDRSATVSASDAAPASPSSAATTPKAAATSTSASMCSSSSTTTSSSQQQQQQQSYAPVCGPLPDLPVIVPGRDTPPGRGCVGLSNLGNTCFMNSILQSLNAVPELAAAFYHPPERIWSSKAVVAPAYSGLVRDMISGALGSVVNPSAFLRKVSKQDSRWGDGRQQDSQEFLNSLLEALQSECNRITSKPVYKELQGKGSEEAQAAEAYAYARTWNDSIVDDIFGGLTQSTLQCLACKRISHTFEPSLGLAVPIPQAGADGCVSVADCLGAFTECEQLEGEDSYKCEACKSCQPHTKRMQIFRPPRVLVLTLKRFAQRGGGGGHSSPGYGGFFSRFRGGGTSKNNTAVELGQEPLDLTPFCNPLGVRGLCVGGAGSGGGRGRSGTSTPVTPQYQLIAVSHHSGSLEGGHYTAQARSCLDGQWYNFNDSHVRREAARPSGASSSAYVLFYRLATLPPPSQQSSL